MKNNILIVDDESNILSSLLRVLQAEDYEIFTAENALDGLDIVKNNEIALVLSDYKMPGMNGVTFLSKVKEISPDSMRLIFTGCTDLEVAIAAINNGEVYRFISKPINAQEIRLTIKQSLDYRTLVLQNGVLTEVVKTQKNVLSKLEQQHPGITQVMRDEQGNIIIADA